MSDRPPNQIARIIAVGGVITMFVLVIIVIASSGGSGGGDSGATNGSSTLNSGQGGGQTSTDPKIAKALEKGVYTVQANDTLTGISEATGIDIQTLIQLNPTTDPQALIEGRTIKLR